MEMTIKNILMALIAATLLLACDSSQENSPEQNLAGTWRFVLHSDGGAMPFNMEVFEENGQLKAFIRNGEEKLLLDSIQTKGDSVIMPLHIFDAALLGKRHGSDTLEGQFVKFYAPDKAVPFTAVRGQNYRFFPDSMSVAPAFDFSGKWEVTFTEPDGSTYPAVGIFQQSGNAVTGTFLTETGDYRYLEGNAAGKALYLSAFDGNHAFLFVATSEDGTQLKGDFWSGKDYHETWTAIRNDSAALRNPYELTYLKEGYDKIDFTLPDLDSNLVSLSDPRYQGKVVILQLFGSWCPNCMDETAFLADWYRKNKDKDIAIIALAFERKPDFQYAKRMVERVKKRFGADYDFLIAGTNDKGEAARVLPMLNHVMSFPTTIFIDKQGKVRKIHTGFYGPGTGEYYERWREEFNATISELLNE
ncbi:peroxiredoxin family protein [Thermonema rossianum]|uniref:peroxiredoxin family protein n=1 Tax=Thermonema rossianum TaxID=55505 RepID=UPI000571683B|nr:TlpA disulfide reductase family protein [Thermonema rossianum]